MYIIRKIQKHCKKKKPNDIQLQIKMMSDNLI